MSFFKIRSLISTLFFFFLPNVVFININLNYYALLNTLHHISTWKLNNSISETKYENRHHRVIYLMLPIIVIVDVIAKSHIAMCYCNYYYCNCAKLAHKSASFTKLIFHNTKKTDIFTRAYFFWRWGNLPIKQTFPNLCKIRLRML